MNVTGTVTNSITPTANVSRRRNLSSVASPRTANSWRLSSSPNTRSSSPANSIRNSIANPTSRIRYSKGLSPRRVPGHRVLPGRFSCPFVSALEKITAGAKESKLMFLIAGGHAVIAHGHQRNTFDLDLIVRREDANQWRQLASGLGY